MGLLINCNHQHNGTEKKNKIKIMNNFPFQSTVYFVQMFQQLQIFVFLGLQNQCPYTEI